MSIVLTGAAGQLGRELVPLLTSVGSIVGVDRVEVPDECNHRLVHDLSDLNATERLLDEVRPEVVVNAAAMTAVDAAEEEQSLAFCLNEELPAMLARWCRNNDAFLLHYSTDYVFDGEGRRPYSEQDKANPFSVYGQSKLAGELAVVDSGCHHVILRSSWIYSGHGNNFLLTMLRLARERDRLGIIADQTGCPTWARNLARASRVVLESALDDNGREHVQGLFHYCDGSETSWHGFASVIFSTALDLGLLDRMPRVDSISTADYPTAARRPHYSVLDTGNFQSQFQLRPPSLEESLQICLGELVHDG